MAKGAQPRAAPLPAMDRMDIRMIPKIKKILDLTQDIYHACPAWPTYKLTNINYEAIYAINGFNAERIDIDSHTGTHVDAPFHFFPGRTTVDEMDLSLFMGRGIAIDLRDINTMAITDKHLEKDDPRIKKGDIVLLYTGWAQKRGMNHEYLYEWPYLTAEAAQFLLDKGVKCVCIDGLSVGGWPQGTGAPPHHVLLGNDIVIIEELYMDEQLFTEEEWYVVALPAKFRGFGGAPTRVVAIAFE
jgi:kynurenine formamidase